MSAMSNCNGSHFRKRDVLRLDDGLNGMDGQAF